MSRNSLSALHLLLFWSQSTCSPGWSQRPSGNTALFINLAWSSTPGPWPPTRIWKQLEQDDRQAGNYSREEVEERSLQRRARAQGSPGWDEDGGGGNRGPGVWGAKLPGGGLYVGREPGVGGARCRRNWEWGCPGLGKLRGEGWGSQG